MFTRWCPRPNNTTPTHFPTSVFSLFISICRTLANCTHRVTINTMSTGQTQKCTPSQYRRHCGQCKAVMDKQVQRKCPHYSAVSANLRAKGILITESDVFCTKCYKAQLEMVKIDGSASTDHKIKSLITRHAQMPDNPLANTIVLAGKALLDASAVLLVTLHEHYQHVATEPRTAKWLLAELTAVLGHHMNVVHPSVKKRGILLMRKGCNTQEVLHDVLAQQRQAALAADAMELDPVPEQHTRIAQDGAVLTTAEIMHRIIQRQGKEFTGKEFESDTALYKLNFSNVIQTTHPTLWKWIWVSLYGTSEEPPAAMPQTRYNQTKCMRAIQVLSAILHAATPQCVYPLQLAVADVVETYSHSTTLLRMLARLGITASRDTFSRYKMHVVDERQRNGIQAEMQLGSISFVSIDNIDKDMPWKRMYCHDQKRGFHGTSVQHVNPQPSTNKEGQAEGPQQTVLPFECYDGASKQHDAPSAKRRRTQKESTTNPEPAIPAIVVSSAVCDVGDGEDAPVANCNSHMLANNPEHEEGNKDATADAHKWYSHTVLSIRNFTLTDEDDKCIKNVQQQAFTHLISTSGSSGLKGFFQEQGGEIPETANVVYLGILDKPADNKDTVKSILDDLYRTYDIGKSLMHLLVVGDGKTYDILLKLQEEYGQSLSWVVPFPGDWHTLKAIQPILMKVYWDAGLQSMAKAMGAKGEGLSAMERCSTFRKTHEFILLAHEAIGRSMLAEYNNIHSKTPTMEELEEFANQQDDDLWSFWRRFYFRDAIAYISLWSAIRGRDWSCRIAAIKMAAPLFHALDRTTYLRLVPRHLAHLQSMPPSILRSLQSGCFSVSLNGTYFNSVALDEAHEMKINKDMKMSMVHPEAASIDRLTYYLPHRAALLRAFQEQVLPTTDEHCDDEGKGKKTQETKQGKERSENVASILRLIQTSNLFKTGVTRKLQNLFTGRMATDAERGDMLGFYGIGLQELIAYATSRLLKVPTCLPPRRQQHLKTFAPATKRKKTVNQKEKDHKLVTTCLKRRLMWNQTNQTTESLAQQLITMPRALTSDGLKPRTGMKSTASKQLEDRYKDVFVNSLPPTFATANTAVIYDAMFLINSSPLACHNTFADYGKFIIQRWTSHWYERGVGSVHFVFDNATTLATSPKAILRISRDMASAGDDTQHEHIPVTENGTLPKAWRKFLGCRQCKQALCAFVSQYGLGNAQAFMTRPNQCFITAGALGNGMNDMAVAAVNGNTTCFLVQDLQSNAEEADNRVWLHASKFETVLVYSPDTDVYHIGMAIVNGRVERSVFVQLDMPGSAQHRYLNVTKLVNNIRNDPDLSQVAENVRVNALQALFVCSGCDFVSFFAGFGKCSFYKSFFQFATFITGKSIAFAKS
ncbi:uncharacterized protein LOC135829829 [Sycon ciliatum]|uniref:uncharacterized protein LOC135829829 n=1 Tax=Sycon ciliatum TaxID=27933 RepID=UPI0031F66AB9